MTVEIGTEACTIPFLGIFVSNFRYCVFAVIYMGSILQPSNLQGEGGRLFAELQNTLRIGRYSLLLFAPVM
jgi:hypothetical protein